MGNEVLGSVGKVFEKRFGGNEKTLLPLHPAAEIKRVSSWKKWEERGVEKGSSSGRSGLKKSFKKTFKKSLDGMRKSLYLCNPNGA